MEALRASSANFIELHRLPMEEAIGSKTEFKCVVVGLGGLGSGTAYWLSGKLGNELLGLEQFEFGHFRGESQDHSRIIRLSYHTPEYVELAKHAYEAWAILEREAGRTLIVRTGGLDFFPVNAAIPLHNYSDSMKAGKVLFELLDASEIMSRWPQWRLPRGTQALYQSQGGIAPAAKCNAEHIRIARQNGSVLLDNTPVKSIRTIGDGIEIVAREATFRCEKLIIAAGPWSNQVLANFRLNLPLTITQEQVTYFATPNQESFKPDRFPTWIWMDDPSFYGFPIYGEQGVKVAQDVGGREVTPETRTFDVDSEALNRVMAFLKSYLPSAVGPSIYTKTCLYTLTPDRDFVIDTLSDNPNVLVTIGAGHAFKFASLIGRILSELAIDGTTKYNIDAFRIDRPILKDKNPKKNFMV